MKIFLVQHGLATSKEEDPRRPLTKEGIGNTKKMAAWLSKQKVVVEEIHHSGKTRAAQTAEIFASQAGPVKGAKQVSGLNPNDDVQQYAQQIDNQKESVMIVGHLPFLDRLAALLVTGDPSNAVISFVNSGVVCLEQKPENYTLAWYVIPGNLNDT